MIRHHLKGTAIMFASPVGEFFDGAQRRIRKCSLEGFADDDPMQAWEHQPQKMHSHQEGRNEV